MISCVIPMYNEEAIAEQSLRTLADALSGAFDEWEIVAVNDGSVDATAEIVDSLSREIPRIRPAGYAVNRGKGAAVREGVLASRGDVVLYTDCDLAYGTDAIEVFARRLTAEGCDAVIGSRNLSREGYEGYTLLRKIASKTYIKVISLAAGFRHSDSQCGIKCFTGDAARRIFAGCRIDGFAFDLEVLMTADALRLDVREEPVKVINHRESTSKVHLVRDTFRMLSDIRRIKKRLKTEYPKS